MLRRLPPMTPIISTRGLAKHFPGGAGPEVVAGAGRTSSSRSSTSASWP